MSSKKFQKIIVYIMIFAMLASSLLVGLTMFF
ncbi:stressosome-associated protein Prli42 [Bacillus aquiflavi]|uniref:Stressosome-associated protein Prli42 n=1 Tax=Bacillus aquiflavi TaxID=2672567 RepID=A0A6B3W023_9BACI|nr:stressosome-associated protein Prli42 [Bacillus aquiflavi]MBA4538213.1 stressosome-associated protein Prli42 [Bacillus aquiflavi]NEY82532.1 stressosome-associated protein Prli42 [Bacillus aquiflavi]UAC47172.1 stressosome-associated protein Prli42 [Bacillus aquiflavi]